MKPYGQGNDKPRLFKYEHVVSYRRVELDPNETHLMRGPGEGDGFIYFVNDGCAMCRIAESELNALLYTKTQPDPARRFRQPYYVGVYL